MNSIVIGLTGQTGAGKSTVAEIMKELSCAVINADKIAREATAIGSDCMKRLAESFGYDIINNDGSCNRKLLAKKAFSSREKTDLLNSITHPWIIKRTKEVISRYKNDGYDIIIFDAPQLFESGGEKLCNYVISVVAPFETRLQRIVSRDLISREEAIMRMKAQYDTEFFISCADFVIDGSAPLEQIKLQSRKIISDIRNADRSE